MRQASKRIPESAEKTVRARHFLHRRADGRMDPPFYFDFKPKLTHPVFRNAAKACRCYLTLVSNALARV